MLKRLIFLNLLFCTLAMANITGQDMFTLKPKTISVSKDEFKGSVLVFLSCLCPCSMGHEARLKELAQKFSDFKFIAIHSNINEPIEHAQAHFQKANLGFDILHDPTQALANQYGALKTPHVFILNLKGKVVFEGGVDNSTNAINASKNYLMDALTDIRNNRAPRVKIVKTLGCAITRTKSS